MKKILGLALAGAFLIACGSSNKNATGMQNTTAATPPPATETMPPATSETPPSTQSQPPAETPPANPESTNPTPTTPTP